MTVQIKKIAPSEIEKESFSIIEKELGSTSFDKDSFKIVQRVIHATGDFSFSENLRFSPDAITRGVTALCNGKNILTDVSMVASGISKVMLEKWASGVICHISDQSVAKKAKDSEKTRSEVAIETSLDDSIGLIAIGNAPTALIQAIKTVSTIEPAKRPLIIGVPVGFVNAVESKELLLEQNDCYITSVGRKGGSPVAAAIVNALIRIAAER